MVVIFQSWWLILAVFGKENVSYFWDAVDSVREPFGIQMIASWQRVHSGLHVSVIYRLVSWTLLHVHHNYKAIKSSSMGRKSHYFMDRKGKWKPNYGGVLRAFMWCAISSVFTVALGSQRDFLYPADKEPASSAELRSWCVQSKVTYHIWLLLTLISGMLHHELFPQGAKWRIFLFQSHNIRIAMNEIYVCITVTSDL